MVISKYLPPKLIVFLKKIIYSGVRIIYHKARVITTVKTEVLHLEKVDVFFGYYDISPFRGDRILYHEHQKNSDTVAIIVDSQKYDARTLIAVSKAWNWQQGSRLRWHPCDSNKIIFNDYDGEKYICRIVDVSNGEEQRIAWPLYDIDNNCTLGISLDFARLGIKRPGYGYTCYKYQQEPDLQNNGIFIVDIKRNKILKTITYNDIAKSIDGGLYDYSDFYINHLSFSPDGKKFLFFWIQGLGGYHKASLLVYDCIAEKIIILEREGKVSHYAWRNNDEILCTVFDSDNECRYFLYSIERQSKRIVRGDVLLRDGHPSFIDQETIVTDTYPDKYGYQQLNIVAINAKTHKNIAQLYSVPVDRAEIRTDLHPRISPDRQKICVDSNNRGTRDIVLFTV